MMLRAVKCRVMLIHARPVRAPTDLYTLISSDLFRRVSAIGPYRLKLSLGCISIVFTLVFVILLLFFHFVAYNHIINDVFDLSFLVIIVIDFDCKHLDELGKPIIG